MFYHSAELRQGELQKELSRQTAQLQAAQADVSTAKSSEEALQQTVSAFQSDAKGLQYVPVSLSS